jgi:hypothetical protein
MIARKSVATGDTFFFSGLAQAQGDELIADEMIYR